MQPIEKEGKTVAEAVESALRELGMSRDQVEVQILQEASKGFLGVGAKPARVRITEKLWGEKSSNGAPAAAPSRKPIGGARPEPESPHAVRKEAARLEPREPKPAAARAESRPARREEPRREPRRSAKPASVEGAPVDTAKACAEAQAALKDLLTLMGLEPKPLSAAWDGVQERVRIGLDGEEAKFLTGGDGRTLEALQFLVTLMVSRKVGGSVAVQVDALGYWDKREKDILSVAEKGIAEVKATGKPYRLPPMDAPMRRLIHRNLSGHPDVETASEGEGSWRKIVIRPRKR